MLGVVILIAYEQHLSILDNKSILGKRAICAAIQMPV